MLETPSIRQYSFMSGPFRRGTGVSSDNLSGADNQQERPGSSAWLDSIPADVGHYVAGFVDGEGSFNVPIRRIGDRGLPWRVSLSFNVSQVGPEAPSFLRQTFGVGTVRGPGYGVFYFEVTTPTALEAREFPLFERFPLRGPKANDLAVFRQIARLVQQGQHLLPNGFNRHPRIASADEPGWQAPAQR